MPISDYDSVFYSILIREHDVFASTWQGVYRARFANGEWMHIQCDPPLPEGGRLAGEYGTDRPVWYATSEGLYLSENDGDSWQVVSDEYDFHSVFVRQNGILYAIAKTQIDYPSKIATVQDLPWCVLDADSQPSYCVRDLLLVSGDSGQTWRDITGDMPAGIELYKICDDPDHSNLVIILGSCLRGYVLQAPDDSYNWELHMEAQWLQDHPPPCDELYQRDCPSYVSGDDKMVMLSNYFELCLGDTTSH